MTEEKETVVVTLIFPNGYAHQLNEVASVTTRNVVYLKRKLLSSVRLLTDSRISRLTFRMRDGSNLAWKSKPGDFKIMRDSALRIMEFAKQRGLAA